MGEVLNDRDAVDLVAHFKAALDAFKAGESFDDRIFRDTLTGSEGRGGCGHIHGELCPRSAAAIDFPLRLPVYVAQIADAPVGGIRKSVALDGAEGAADAFGHILASIVSDDKPAARNQIDEALEGGLHCFEVGVNVGVVEFDVRENERVGEVVEKFGAFVEEGGVVLVAFDDEWLRGTKLEA